MKTIDNSTPAILSGDFESRGLTIEANGKAFKELISGIYADKAYAIARETIANGIDSHELAGCPERPLVIHLPTGFEPHYSLRDYGVSMAHDMVMTLYSTLFRSTKDDPNSDQSNRFTGKFGLGSKSPFAYTDAFQLTTFLDGTQRVYDIFFNGGSPKIALFLEQPTEEENGVLVTFGVAPKDERDFERAITRAVEPLEVMPIFTGKQPKLHVRSVKSEGKGWKLLDSTQSGNAEARQGSVLYPLNFQAVIDCPPELQPLFKSSFRFDFAIGQLDVVTSREALSYDKETSQNIITRLQEVIEEIKQQVNDQIAGAETYWEFCEAYYKAMEAFPENTFGKLISKSGSKFKGRAPQKAIEVKTQNVRKSIPNVADPLKASIVTFHARFGTMTYCKVSAYDIRNKVLSFRTDRDGERNKISLVVGVPLIVVLEDMREKNRYPAARMATLTAGLSAADRQSSQLLWIRHYGDSQYVMNRLFVAFGRPKMKVFNLMEVPHTAPPREYFRGQRVPYKVLDKLSNTWENPEPDAVIPDQAWCVPMRNGSVDITVPHFSETRMNELRDIFLKVGEEDIPIIGVPASGRKLIKNNPDWVDFYSFASETIWTLFDQDDYNHEVYVKQHYGLPDIIDTLEILKLNVKARKFVEATHGCILADLLQVADKLSKKKVSGVQYSIFIALEQIDNHEKAMVVSANYKAEKEFELAKAAGTVTGDFEETPFVSKTDEFKKIANDFAKAQLADIKRKAETALAQFPLFRAFNVHNLTGASKTPVCDEIVNYIFNKRLVDGDAPKEVVDIAKAA